MKETTKMSRTIGTLEKMFRIINTDKFDGKLPEVIITVQETRGAYGHFTAWKSWENAKNETSTYEINIGANTLNRPIEQLTATLIHEMIHLYCHINGIQDTSRGGTYHNRRFGEIAERMGLDVEKDSRYGYVTGGLEHPKVLEYCLEREFTEFCLNRNPSITPRAAGGKMFPTTGTVQKRQGGVGTPKSHSIKYQCPKCKCSVRATKKVNIGCLDCEESMIEC